MIARFAIIITLFLLSNNILLGGIAEGDTSSFFKPSTELNKKRLNGVVLTESIGGGLLMVGLDQLWYASYPRSGFHFFNDNDEWRGMDKLGHGLTAYYGGVLGYKVLRWTGLNKKKSAIWGGSFGFMFLSIVETLDGFSSEWGASPGDLIANATGTAFFIGQQVLWDEQRIQFKWSYMPTEFAQYRPNLLGKNWTESWLKDYNGQTYWASLNIASFLSEESNFPKWLNLAVGYGAQGMTGGSSNPTFVNGVQIPEFERYSQFYLSLDIDLNRLKTKYNWVNVLLPTFGFLKVPSPTLEYNTTGKLKFHWLYF